MPCVTFKLAVETLIKTLDSDGREYVQNFPVDFLQISDETLNNLFKTETKLSESRTKPNTFDVKVYYKSEKNRSQVLKESLNDCNKVEYMNKRRKRTFYKKIWLLLLEIENELVKKSNWFTIISRNQSLLWETKRRGRKERKKPQISDLKIDEGNSENSQENDNSWFSSWSALSTTFDSPKSKKGEFSNDDEEEDKWWSSFCSKERNESKSESFFSTQPSSSSQSTQATNIPTQTCVDNKEDDDEDDSKVELFFKPGKHDKFEFL